MFWPKYLELCNSVGKAPNVVAAEIGVKSTGTVTGWKNGAQPRISVLRRLSDYFNVPISELCAEKSEKSDSFYDMYNKLCKGSGKTPNGVAKELGFASSSVTQWKHGATPRPAALKKFADYFEVSVECFLTDGQNEEPTPVSEDGSDELIPLINGLPSEQRELLLAQVRAWTAQNQPSTTIKLNAAAQGDSDIETEMDLDPGFKLPSSVQAVPDEYKGKTDGTPSAPEEK